jgi:hypothetical protein
VRAFSQGFGDAFALRLQHYFTLKVGVLAAASKIGREWRTRAGLSAQRRTFW